MEKEQAWKDESTKLVQKLLKDKQSKIIRVEKMNLDLKEKHEAEIENQKLKFDALAKEMSDLKKQISSYEKHIIDETTDWPSTTVKTAISNNTGQWLYKKSSITQPKTQKNSNYYSFLNSETQSNANFSN